MEHWEVALVMVVAGFADWLLVVYLWAKRREVAAYLVERFQQLLFKVRKWNDARRRTQ